VSFKVEARVLDRFDPETVDPEEDRSQTWILPEEFLG
jgi:hypothetical protein